MSAAASLSEPFAAHQRAVGELCVGVRRRGAATVLADLRQAGCLKARFPRRENAEWIDVVTLNISGGIAAGDRLLSEFAVGDGARATIAAQAAERFYRALPDAPPARVRTNIAVGAAAAAEWLPQHSILFDRCALDRMLCIELAADAWFLGVESLVFGRAAMGEVVGAGSVRDVIRVRRDGRLLLHDAIRLDGPIAAHLARPAVARGARAVATLIHVAPDAEGSVGRLRTALDRVQKNQPRTFTVMPGLDPGIHAVASRTNAGDGRIKSGHDGLMVTRDGPHVACFGLSEIESGVSAWDGMLLARILAPDGASLRAAVIAGLQAIRGGRMLPRVWLC